MPLSLTYLYLALAIVLEVIATSALKASDSFSRLAPTVLTVSGIRPELGMIPPLHGRPPGAYPYNQKLVVRSRSVAYL